MSLISIRQCAYFLAVAETGGITAAARKLNISQPAVAQAIDKLEETTGLLLFERLHAKGMVLTSQGDAFLNYASELLASSEKLETAAHEIAQGHEGTIRLGCFQSLAPFYLSTIFQQYRNEYPAITLEVAEKLQGDLIEELNSNHLDFAIMYDLGIDANEIDYQILQRIKPYLIVSKTHPLAKRSKVSIREIAEEKYVLFDAAHSNKYFQSIFGQYDLNPQVVFRSTTIESVRCCVADGIGVSLLAAKPVSSQTYIGKEVVEVEIEEEIADSKVVIAWSNKRRHDPMRSAFIDFCSRLLN